MTEINDFGYPQNSEIDTLKSYITTESIMSTTIAPVRRTHDGRNAIYLLLEIGGIFQDHSASHRVNELASWRCQI